MSTNDTDNDIERGVYQTPSNDDDLYDDYDDEEGFGRGPLFGILAVIVLSAMFGIVWFAFQMGLDQGRDTAPPVISASLEPFKVEPDEPGGMAEPEQTLTNAAISGQPIDQVEGVTSSSETPIEVPQERPAETQMAANDVVNSAPELRTSNVEVGSSGGVVVPRPSARVQNSAPDEDLRQATQQPSNSAPANTLPNNPPVTQPDVQPATRETDAQSQPPVQTPPATRPQPVTVQDASIGPPLVGPATTNSAPANTGNYVVQVASFPEIPDANAAWARLQSRHGGIVGSHVQDIQDVDLGDRGTWYRLRIGYFETRSAATSLCEQLQAANQDCLVASR